MTKQAIDDAKIQLDTAAAGQGVGGGGTVTSIPFVAQSVRLGDAVQHDVHGVYTPEGNPLSMFPFAAAGMLSHEFFKPYALTFDFTKMQIVLRR